MFKFLRRSSHKIQVVHAEDLKDGDIFVHDMRPVRVEEIKTLGPDDIYALIGPISNGQPCGRPRLICVPREQKIMITRKRSES